MDRVVFNDASRSSGVDFVKYAEAAKTLLPYRSSSKKKPNVLPSAHAGLWSFVTMSWLTSLMWKAFRCGLTKDDMWDLHENDQALKNAERLHCLWDEELKAKGKDNCSFGRVVWRFGKTRFLVAILLMAVCVIFQFLGPAWILKALIAFVEDLSQPVEVGISLAFVALIVQTIRNLCFNGLWMIGIHTGLRLQGAMQLMMYEKMLRLKVGGEKILSQTLTFCSNDQQRIFECVTGGVLAIAAPVMFTMCVIYTCIVLGPWGLIGNLIVFLFYPIMGVVARYIGQIRRQTVKYTNKRIGYMTEILNFIKYVKLVCWEDKFLTCIGDFRRDEERELRKAAFLQSLTATLTPMINILASIATFLVYTLAGNDMTASEVFTIFSVFQAMQFTLGTLPFAIRSISEAAVSFDNFKEYMLLPEFRQNLNANGSVECHHDAVLVIKNGNFSWEVPTSNGKSTLKKTVKNGVSNKDEETNLMSSEGNQPTEFLSGINLEIRRGRLVGVCGAVGSGKSSLLSAILGDMHRNQGDILIRGSLAVVSQQAWIYSDTLQENILFGMPLNKDKYEHVLNICCLRPDILALPKGDQTLIGDRGVNLSGGQKQRLNLARSIYADKSIYLLDDPLSAVDSIVGKEIFQKCIKEHLQEKTIILVTNNLQVFSECDEVVFMSNGTIVEHGPHQDLMKNKGAYAQMMETYGTNETLTDLVAPQLPPVGEQHSKKFTKNNFKDVDMEESTDSRLAGVQAYAMYIKGGGGCLYFCFIISFVLLFGIGQQLTAVWLQQWLDAGDGLMDERIMNMTELNNTLEHMEELGENGTDTVNMAFDNNEKLRGNVTDNPDIGYYQLGLVIIMLCTYGVGIVKGFFMSRFALRATSKLHENMCSRIIKCPMSFFDNMPRGRILNRFSKDIDELDARLPFLLEFVIQSLMYILVTMIVICVIYPLVSILIISVVVVMGFLDLWLNIGVQETKKLENVFKSPVLHHIQSSMGGLSVIRTYHRQSIFERRFCEHLSKHMVAESVFRIANRWFTLRMDTVGVIAIFSVALTAVFIRNEVSSALIALALSNVYSVSTFMPFLMRMKSEMQARFLSVQRILEYSEDLSVEEQVDPADEDVPENWATQAPEVKFDNVYLRYGDELPWVLKGVSFVVKPKEKIVVVGRTGAGKSSLVAALMRLVNINNGYIKIDETDPTLAPILLKTLRSRISVLTQDPVLFRCSIRKNMDIFCKHQDSEIWDALEKVHMKDRIASEKEGLDYIVEADAENFSAGERQLLCLARAFLQKNKILVLDEATSIVDVETDALIHKMVKEVFADCTIINISHRLSTAEKFDKVLVMSDGQVIEYDTPKNLMSNHESTFYKMMSASGITALAED